MARGEAADVERHADLTPDPSTTRGLPAFEPRDVDEALQDLEDDSARTGRELDGTDVQRAAERHRLSVTSLAVLRLRAEALGLISASKDDRLPIGVGGVARHEQSFALESLERWLEDARRFPLLTAQQEVALARAIESGIAASGELNRTDATQLPADVKAKLEGLVESGGKAKAVFIESNLRLVASIAKHFRGSRVDFVDLLQEGVLGLVRAVEKFEWRLGYKFSTYATWWIRQSIHRAVDNQSGLIRIPVHVREKIRRVKRKRRELELQLGREVTLRELADATGLDAAHIAFVIDLDNDVVSLDRPMGAEADALRLADLIADNRPDDHARLLEQAADRELVSQFLELLSARERLVLTRRFGLDDGVPDTLQQVGDSLHLTRERIRQIQGKAMKKLTKSKLARRARVYR